MQHVYTIWESHPLDDYGFKVASESAASGTTDGKHKAIVPSVESKDVARSLNDHDRLHEHLPQQPVPDCDADNPKSYSDDDSGREHDTADDKHKATVLSIASKDVALGLGM